MTGRVGASSSLLVGWITGKKRPHVFIERRGGVLLRVELDEVRHLVDALTDAAVYVISDTAGAEERGGDIIGQDTTD